MIITKEKEEKTAKKSKNKNDEELENQNDFPKMILEEEKGQDEQESIQD